MTYQEINSFLSHFNTDYYNKKQIGSSRKTIFDIYEYLKKLNIPEESANMLIEQIAYLTDKDFNISLYLELLSHSLGFSNEYELKDIIKVVKEVHKIYYDSAALISLDDYLHDTNESRIKKLFLSRNGKYLIKNFTAIDFENYIIDLKLAAAIAFNKNEYNEFIKYIIDFENFRNSYSPIINFKTYLKARDYLKSYSRLFWDLVFGNEYLVALNKHDICITELYPKKELEDSKIKDDEKYSDTLIQLDLFTYQEYDEEPKFKVTDDIKSFQIATIYKENTLPDYNSEKDLLAYYNNLLKNKEVIVLPKLNTIKNRHYMYEIS